MRSGKKIRISQCMIVKNEEKNIEKALSWGRSVMWEQIVVDTGSTDRTVEIAKKLGAKVFSFPWIDDFAAAKNYAIGKATGAWIALLDADEYMTPKDAGKLPNLLRQLEERKLEGLSTGWQQLDDEGKIFSSGTQIRIFRNDPDIRYRRRIHEQLESVSGRELRVGDAVQELSIFHTGYQSRPSEEKKKSGRNRRIIGEELKDHPEDYEMLGYMGDECFGDGEPKEAEAWYRRAIACMPASLEEYDQRSAVTFTRLLTLLTEQEHTSPEEMEKIYQKAVGLLPKEADFDYMLGRFFADKEQPEQAIRYLETALSKLDAYGCNNRALILAGNLLEAYDLLVRCCFEAGNSQKCVNYAVTYLRYDPYGMGVLTRLLRTLLPESGGQAEQEAVLGFLKKLYDVSSLKDRLFLVKAAEHSDRMDFTNYLRQGLFTAEEQQQVGL